MTEKAWKMCFIFIIEISTKHVYTFCIGTIGFLIPKNMGIDIKIVTLALLEAKLWPNMWFRWRPFWMCHKTRLRGGKNWTPIFLAYLTPNEAIKKKINFGNINGQNDIPLRTNSYWSSSGRINHLSISRFILMRYQICGDVNLHWDKEIGECFFMTR